jgi:hypothetical protein
MKTKQILLESSTHSIHFGLFVSVAILLPWLQAAEKNAMLSTACPGSSRLPEAG